jgi:hypothetical protein
MIRFLSSLRVTVTLCFSLAVLLLGGVLFGRLPSWRMVIRSSLNKDILINWFFEHSTKHPVISIWLAITAILALLFFLNLVLSCSTLLWQRCKSVRNWENILLFVIHVAFGAVLVCHGLSFVSGHKTSGLLAEGDTMKLPDGRIVTVEKVNFGSDTKLLTSGRHDRTRDKYHWEENYVVLKVDGSELSPLRHMYPVKDDSHVQYSLAMFMDAARPMGMGHGHGKQGQAGPSGNGNKRGEWKAPAKPKIAASIIAKRNYFDGLFVASFMVVLITMTAYLILTWNKRLGSKSLL